MTRFVPVFLIATLLLLSSCGGDEALTMTRFEVVPDVRTAVAGLRALTYDGEHIWVSRWDDRGRISVVIKLGLDGTAFGTFPAGFMPEGLTYDGANIWAVNTRDDLVTKLALDGTTLGTFAAGGLPQGKYLDLPQVQSAPPEAVLFDGENVWVANTADNTVSKLTLDGSVIGTFQVGNKPISLATNVGSRYVFVHNTGDKTITLLNRDGISMSTNSLDSYRYTLFDPQVPKRTFRNAFLNLNGDPGNAYRIEILFDGHAIWMAHARDMTVTKLGLDGKILFTVALGEPRRFPSPIRALTFDGENVWVATAGSVVKLGQDGTKLATVPIQGAPVGLVSGGGTLWVLFETSSDSGGLIRMGLDGSVLNTFPLWSNRTIGALTYDGESVWVGLDFWAALFSRKRFLASVVRVTPNGKIADEVTLGEEASIGDMIFDGKHIWVLNHKQLHKISIDRE